MSESLKQKAKTGFEIETEIGSVRCMNVGTAKQKIGRDKRLQTLLEEKWVLVSVAQQEIAMQVEKAKDPLHIKINALQLAILSIYKPKIESLERERGLQKQKLRSILEDMQKIPERRLPLDKIGWLQEWGDVIVALGRLLE